MSNSTRQNILNQLEVLLEALTQIKKVEQNRSTPVDLETQPLPCAFIYSGPERKLGDDRAVIGRENWEWVIPIEIWSNNKDLETLLKLIHDYLFQNRTLGGYAVTSERTGVDVQSIDLSRDLKSMIIEYTVLYRHTIGVM